MQNYVSRSLTSGHFYLAGENVLRADAVKSSLTHRSHRVGVGGLKHSLKPLSEEWLRNHTASSSVVQYGAGNEPGRHFLVREPPQQSTDLR